MIELSRDRSRYRAVEKFDKGTFNTPLGDVGQKEPVSLLFLMQLAAQNCWSVLLLEGLECRFADAAC